MTKHERRFSPARLSAAQLRAAVAMADTIAGDFARAIDAVATDDEALRLTAAAVSRLAEIDAPPPDPYGGRAALRELADR